MKKLIFAFVALSFSNIIFAQEIKKRIEIPQEKSTETHKAEVLDYVKSNRLNVLYIENFNQALKSDEIKDVITTINEEVARYVEKLDFAKHDEAFKKSLIIKESELLAIFEFEATEKLHQIRFQFKDILSARYQKILYSEYQIEDQTEDAVMDALYNLKNFLFAKAKKYDGELQVEQFNLDGFSLRNDINDSSRDSIKDLLRKEKIEIIQKSKVRNV